MISNEAKYYLACSVGKNTLKMYLKYKIKYSFSIVFQIQNKIHHLKMYFKIQNTFLRKTLTLTSLTLTLEYVLIFFAATRGTFFKIFKKKRTRELRLNCEKSILKC